MPDSMGITTVFDEPKGKVRRGTYTLFPSKLHERNGTENRVTPKPKLQVSHATIGASPFERHKLNDRIPVAVPTPAVLVPPETNDRRAKRSAIA